MNTAQSLLLSWKQADVGEDLLSFGNKLLLLAELRRKRHSLNLTIPNLIVETSDSIPSKMILQQITELISTLNLIRFVGEDRYICVEYKDDESSLYSLVSSIRNAAGFYGEFRGVVGIKLNKLLMPEYYEYLFLLIQQHSEIIFLLFLPSKEKETSKRALKNELMKRTPIQHIEIQHQSIPNMVSLIQKELHNKGFSLSQDSFSVLQQAITILAQNKCFLGKDTLIQLAESIAWKMLEKSGERHRIKAEDLQFLTDANSLLTQYCEEKTNSIGF